MTELSIDGERFNVEVEGQASKPALVLAHTLGTTLSLWNPQMPDLLQHFRVVRYDSRGHGASSEGHGPYAIARLGRDVLAILDALEIERAHFLGLSLGGAVGQWLLVNAADRIERAILANTAARLGTASMWNARIRSVLADGMRANVETAIERWFSPAYREAHADVIDAFRTTLRAMSPTGYAACCAALRDMDFREALRGVPHPVLVISGSDDPVITKEDIAALTGALPNVRHVALPSRHISNVEAADPFTDEVVKFLTSRTSMRAARKAAPAARKPHPAPRGALRTGARVSAAARRPAAAATAKPSRPQTAPTRAKPAHAATPARAGKTGRAVRAAPASREPTAKPASTDTRARKTPASVTVAPATRGSPRTAASKSAAAPTTARTRTAPRATGKAPLTKAPSSKLASRKAASVTSASVPKSLVPRAEPKGAPRRAAKIASSRQQTPSAAARPAKTAVTKKATGKAVAQETASKSPRKGSSAKLPTPQRKPQASAGPLKSRGKGPGPGASKGPGRGSGKGPRKS